MPKALDKEKQDTLMKYWEEGMKSTSNQKAIEKAAKETLLSTTKVKVGVNDFCFCFHDMLSL
jgi:hypothetical protein